MLARRACDEQSDEQKVVSGANMRYVALVFAFAVASLLVLSHLGSADVGGGLVPPDVLLPGLHRHPEARLALGVNSHPDDAPRHLR